jgi:hypothetical protein
MTSSAAGTFLRFIRKICSRLCSSGGGTKIWVFYSQIIKKLSKYNCCWHLSVYPSWPYERFVKQIRPVCGSDDYNLISYLTIQYLVFEIKYPLVPT